MTDERRPRRIEVSRDVADREAMPDDLDANVLGPYSVPDVARRRTAGLVYVVGAVIVAGSILLGLPSGMWVVVAGLLVIAAYHVISGWHLRVRQGEALTIANRSTEFPAGHASATLNFEGWRARPVWNVLVFSADEPPSRRALVRVDARTGDVVGSYEEAVPEIELAG
ncbi:MAG: PepSY domain-containing protein [Acidimicrobiia bacterium]|nr:PepSY domain-containing protein [Acidimicrobiia bacterium]NNK92013.1 PepSY domain-containing protein [Acidimicrobiia bacterium]